MSDVKGIFFPPQDGGAGGWRVWYQRGLSRLVFLTWPCRQVTTYYFVWLFVILVCPILYPVWFSVCGLSGYHSLSGHHSLSSHHCLSGHLCLSGHHLMSNDNDSQARTSYQPYHQYFWWGIIHSKSDWKLCSKLSGEFQKRPASIFSRPGLL